MSTPPTIRPRRAGRTPRILIESRASNFGHRRAPTFKHHLARFNFLPGEYIIFLRRIDSVTEPCDLLPTSCRARAMIYILLLHTSRSVSDKFLMSPDQDKIRNTGGAVKGQTRLGGQCQARGALAVSRTVSRPRFLSRRPIYRVGISGNAYESGRQK